MADGSTDEVLDALAALTEVLSAAAFRVQVILGQATELRVLRLSGMTHREAMERLGRPVIGEQLTDTMSAIQRAGHRLRVAEARALRAEGARTGQIAELFGVSRQRVLALLRAVRDE